MFLPIQFAFVAICSNILILRHVHAQEESLYAGQHQSNVVEDPRRNNRVLWAPMHDSSGAPLGIPNSLIRPNVSGFGTRILSHSSELTTDYWFLLTLLGIEANIYDYYRNWSATVENYVFKPHNPSLPPMSTPLNISAVGRGREPDIPITFNYGALVLMLRWLGQISGSRRPGAVPRTWTWVEFACVFNWKEHAGGNSSTYIVAVGNFTPYGYPKVGSWEPSVGGIDIA